MENVGRVRELYEENPKSAERFGPPKGYSFSLGRFLSELESNPPKSWDLPDLDAYYKEKNGRELVIALAELPHKAVFDEFGEHALFWTWAKFVHGREKLAKSVAELTNRDPELLEKSHLFPWRLLEVNDGSTVYATYNLIENLEHGALKDINLRDILEASVRPGMTLSEKRIRDYSLEFMTTNNGSPYGFERNWGQARKEGDKGGIVLDAPVGVGFFYKGEPNAVFSGIPINPGTFMAYQIQGVKLEPFAESGQPREQRPSRGLFPFDVGSLGVLCLEEVARQNGFDTMAIRSGHNNEWAKHHGGGKGRLELENAIKRYDETAERFGYTQGDKGDWFKSVAKSENDAAAA